MGGTSAYFLAAGLKPSSSSSSNSILLYGFDPSGAGAACSGFASCLFEGPPKLGRFPI